MKKNMDLSKNKDRNKWKLFVQHYKKFNSMHLFSNEFTEKYGLDKISGCDANRIHSVIPNISKHGIISGDHGMMQPVSM